MSTRQGLRVDTSGLRRRMGNMSDLNRDGDSIQVTHLQMKPPFTVHVPWVVWLLLWIVSLIAGLYVGSHYMCAFKEGLIKADCKSPDYIYTPVLMDHVVKGMKTNRRVKHKTSTALMNGKFDLTAIWKKNLYFMDIDVEENKYVNHNPDGLNSSVHIAAIVYSNQYNTRIGEVALPLTALYYENSIDQMTIIDDTANHKSAELWEQEILFDDKLPSEQLKITDLFDENVQQRYRKWDAMEAIKPHSKQFLRTSNIGIWKAYEMGSRLAYVPKTKKHSQQQSKNKMEVLLFLDTFHQLPFDDEWVRNAVALFEQYENLQVLGGFSGVIKQGHTFGDVSVRDMRSANMDAEAKVFVMSRESNYYSQMVNKRRYDESRVNIVELMNKYKQTYFDQYWTSFWAKAKQMYKNDNPFVDDDDEPVGLFSMEFLNDFDAEVFLNEDEPHFDHNKVQTGLEGIQFIVKKRFLEQYEKEIERRLPIPAKILKKINEDRLECVQIMKGDPSEKEEEKCDILLQPGGQTVVDYFFIPYEQKIRTWNALRNGAGETWIPFMFITCARMGPLFIRKDWWFDKLLPHLSRLEAKMGKLLDGDWLDMEISLFTWSLGGYVGLYDAEGFKFDRDDFEIGLDRNKDTSAEWDAFQRNHHLTVHPDHKDWDVWNVSHLVELNEKEIANNIGRDDKTLQKLRLRTSIDATSANPAHPTALENSRQIMLGLQALEEQLDEKIYAAKKKESKIELIRLQNKNEFGNENPLN